MSHTCDIEPGHRGRQFLNCWMDSIMAGKYRDHGSLFSIYSVSTVKDTITVSLGGISPTNSTSETAMTLLIIIVST